MSLKIFFYHFDAVMTISQSDDRVVREQLSIFLLIKIMQGSIKFNRVIVTCVVPKLAGQ